MENFENYALLEDLENETNLELEETVEDLNSGATAGAAAGAAAAALGG